MITVIFEGMLLFSGTHGRARGVEPRGSRAGERTPHDQMIPSVDFARDDGFTVIYGTRFSRNFSAYYQSRFFPYILPTDSY
jgi:hypothetical protein